MHFSRLAQGVCFFSLGLLSLTLSAQTRHFTVQISPTPDQYGIFRVSLENRGHTNITAAQIRRVCTGSPEAETQALSFDSLAMYMPREDLPKDPGIPPGTSRPFDLSVGDPSHAGGRCTVAAAVIFADDHCEEISADHAVCKSMLLNRQLAVAELAHTVALIQALPRSQSPFVSVLADALNARRMELTQGKPEGSRNQMDGRDDIVMQILAWIQRRPGDIPVQFTSPDQAILALQRWQARLAKGIAAPVP